MWDWHGLGKLGWGGGVGFSSTCVGLESSWLGLVAICKGFAALGLRQSALVSQILYMGKHVCSRKRAARAVRRAFSLDA